MCFKLHRFGELVNKILFTIVEEARHVESKGEIKGPIVRNNKRLGGKTTSIDKTGCWSENAHSTGCSLKNED
jgi:hypothetical protein